MQGARGKPFLVRVVPLSGSLVSALSTMYSVPVPYVLSLPCFHVRYQVPNHWVLGHSEQPMLISCAAEFAEWRWFWIGWLALGSFQKCVNPSLLTLYQTASYILLIPM